MLDRVTLLIANNMAVNSQRNPWVTVAKLLLDNGRCRAVCEQGTSRSVTHGMEPAALIRH
jgi:hypothetical protein